MMSALALSPLADAVAASLLPPAAQPAAAARLGLADLSLTPRHGCKGPGAAGWLAAHGLPVPARPIAGWRWTAVA